MVIDRSLARPVMIFSQAGGMEIEEVAERSPELVLKEFVDPNTGWMPYHGRALAYRLDPLPQPETLKELISLAARLYKTFLRFDCTLAEINPLVITETGDLHCLDAKLGVDGNALYRQNELREMHDPSQDDEREAHAAQWELNYVALDGNIGCMVNGAGLAMATMDVIKLNGGEPANFLDVGGGSDARRVKEAFKLILSSESIEAILVNIFGGIVRCDEIAEGIIAAIREVGVSVPVVVRLEGTNVEKGKALLNESGLAIIAADDLNDAAQKVIAAAA